MTTDEQDRDWVAVFDDAFRDPEAAVFERVMAETFGDEYPAELGTYSFTTRTELARIVEEVRVGPGELLVDVGSGRGGPGLWVAARTGADHLAVDITEQGLREVTRRAAALGLAERSRTSVGAFEDLPLADGAADAVMSVDALLFTPDKAAACRELARVLRPGGRLVLTTWDYHSQPPGRPPQVDDHRPLLDQAGFDVLGYDATPRWRERQERFDALLLAHVDEIAEADGEDPAEVRAGIEEMHATVATMLRRVLVVAQRRH